MTRWRCLCVCNHQVDRKLVSSLSAEVAELGWMSLSPHMAVTHANFPFLVIGVSKFLSQRCCQMYTFSVGLCFQEGRSGVYCSVHPLNPGPNIGTVAAASVVSRPLLATLHYEAPLKLGHWDHQPTSRVRFEKMSNILKWYLSDGAVWAGPAWQGWWCQQFGPNIILIYWHHPPALLQEYEILLI